MGAINVSLTAKSGDSGWQFTVDGVKFEVAQDPCALGILVWSFGAEEKFLLAGRSGDAAQLHVAKYWCQRMQMHAEGSRLLDLKLQRRALAAAIALAPDAEGKDNVRLAFANRLQRFALGTRNRA